MLWKNPATVSCTYSRKPILWYSRSVYSSWDSVIVPRKIPLDQTRSGKTSPIPWSLSPAASKRRLCSEAFEAWHVDLGKTDARNAALPDGRFGIGRYPLHMAGSSCVIMCVFDVEDLAFGVENGGVTEFDTVMILWLGWYVLAGSPFQRMPIYIRQTQVSLASHDLANCTRRFLLTMPKVSAQLPEIYCVYWATHPHLSYQIHRLPCALMDMHCFASIISKPVVGVGVSQLQVAPTHQPYNMMVVPRQQVHYGAVFAMLNPTASNQRPEPWSASLLPLLGEILTLLV